MLSQAELENYLHKVVALYNRYRQPEATAKLVKVMPEKVTVEFSGSFCYGCGVLDYFEDLIYEFKALTDKAELEIATVRQISQSSFEVEYTIRVK